MAGVREQLEIRDLPITSGYARVVAPHQPAGSKFYRPELDTLRFFAFLTVFVCHTMPDADSFFVAHGFSLFTAGFLAAVGRATRNGVDLFFVLSAYLITVLLLREKAETGTLNVPSFYLRRVLRIWPLYFFAIAVGIGVTLVDKQQHLPLSYLIAFLLLAGNWVTGLWGPPASVIFPLWSVSFEEQFYLLWPLVVRKASTRTIRHYAVGMILVASISRWIFLHRGWHEGLWENSLTRLEPIAFGILLAIVMRGALPKIQPVKRIALIAAGISLWIGTWFFCNVNFSIPGTMVGYPLIAAGSTAILVGTLGGDAKLLQNRALVYLGKISYGLYVYHMLGLRISYWIFKGRTSHLAGYGVFWLAAFALTILMAAISYRFLEKPFLAMKRKNFTVVDSRPE